MAWPYLDPLTREEMVADQFWGLDNHELRVQAATSDVRRIEDLMRIAHSLETVEGEETGRDRVRRGPTQARFTDETERSESEATRIADQIWAKIGPELRQSQDPVSFFIFWIPESENVKTLLHLQISAESFQN